MQFTDIQQNDIQKPIRKDEKRSAVKVFNTQ